MPALAPAVRPLLPAEGDGVLLVAALDGLVPDVSLFVGVLVTLVGVDPLLAPDSDSPLP